MDVILSKDVQSLGKTGDVLKVKDGFARNYLFLQDLAYPATEANLKKIEQQKIKKAAVDAKNKKEAEGLAEKLNKLSCTVTVEVNDREKLYGSVTESDIARSLEVEGFSIDKKSIVLEKPIEELGIFDVDIKLYPGVVAKIRLWVAKK